MNDRRTFLKTSGLAALGLATLSGLDQAGAAGSSPQWAMIIDLKRCTGCQSCVIACKAHHRTAAGFFNTKIRVSERGAYPEARAHFTPLLCNHCASPPCVAACPTKATFKLASGIVVTDWERCTGSGNCVSACPYQARFLDPEHRKADKCDFCLDRLARGLAPVCVESCPSGARIFGNLKAPTGEFGRYLARYAQRPQKNGSRVWYLPERGQNDEGQG